MTAIDITLLIAFGLELAGAGDAAENKAVPPIVPTQWSYSCPAERIGADGLLLCRASYLGYPKLDVERTDTGMKLTFVSQCRDNNNPNASSKYVYQPFGMPISFSPTANSEEIIALLRKNFAKIPAISRKVCGSKYGYKKFEIDESQIGTMIEFVFIKKKLPH